MIAFAVRAAPIDQEFLCYPADTVNHFPSLTVHGNDALTRKYGDELLWYITANKMVAGPFILAEVGCGAGCIRLASVDGRTGVVRWLPKTISSWPVKMLQPVRYRSDSRLIVVSGKLDERGAAGPFHFLLDVRGFHLLAEKQICARP